MPIKALAEEHGGKRTVSYNQAKGLKQNWRQLIPQSQGGVCGGLALMWLARTKIRVNKPGIPREICSCPFQIRGTCTTTRCR